MAASFGSLIIFDLKNCLNKTFSKDDKELLQEFINNLVELMDMKKIGNTQFEYFEPTDFNISNGLVGYSITQIISMSSITMHICEGSGLNNIYLDIFTCCKITDVLIIKIKELILTTFRPTSYTNNIIGR